MDMVKHTRYFYVGDGKKHHVAAFHARWGADVPGLVVMETFSNDREAMRRVAVLNTTTGEAGASCPVVDRSPTVGGDLGLP